MTAPVFAHRPPSHVDPKIAQFIELMSELDDDALARVRLRLHFAAVLGELSQSDVTHLSQPQMEARAAHLAELARYAEAGSFPKNRDFPGALMPYFVDADGTRCAMAHLIEQSGHGNLMADIASSRNNAFVRELAGDLALTKWLEEAGLAAEEAARIQPTYCSDRAPADCACEGAGANVDIALVTTIAVREEPIEGTERTKHVATVRVDEVHGDASVRVEVGDEVEIDAYKEVGQSDYMQVEAGQNLIPRWRFTEDGFTGGCWAGEMVQLDPATAIDALQSDSCVAKMTAVKASWGEVAECENPHSQTMCTTGSALGEMSSMPSIAGFLCAIATAMLVGRRRGR